MRKYLVYIYRVDYVNFCFAYIISWLHNSRQNEKKPPPNVRVRTQSLLWSAAAICMKSCCLQVEKRSPKMVHALKDPSLYTFEAVQRISSHSHKQCVTLWQLQWKYNMVIFMPDKSSNPSTGKKPSHYLTCHFQLRSCSNQFIMFTLHSILCFTLNII